jgi:hypothetical protein
MLLEANLLPRSTHWAAAKASPFPACFRKDSSSQRGRRRAPERREPSGSSRTEDEQDARTPKYRAASNEGHDDYSGIRPSRRFVRASVDACFEGFRTPALCRTVGPVAGRRSKASHGGSRGEEGRWLKGVTYHYSCNLYHEGTVVGSLCVGLMSASPNGPRPAKAHVWRAGGLDMGDEPPQFLDADGHQGCGVDHAAGDRLLLFALSEATVICVSFKRARNPARKAKAIIDSVMCRCQPCQERASQW